MIPGLCEGDVARRPQTRPACSVEKGPKDLREIPQHFGRAAAARDYGAWDIEILAEINNAPRLTREQIRAAAEYFRTSGADVIDIGCTPGLDFPDLGDVVRDLVAARLARQHRHVRSTAKSGPRSRPAPSSCSASTARISTSRTTSPAPAHGSLSCPISARRSTRWTAASRRSTKWGVPYLLDPILEPIGFGFTASLERYAETRRRYPDAEMLMGIGNLTELTAADSTGVNAMLIAVCQELGIRSVLTTEVIPWAKGAVREIDVARRLMHYAVTHRTIPKGVDDRLVTIKDPAVLTFTEDELRALQARITDPNFRIFADADAITVLNNEQFVRGTNIQEIFAQLGVDEPTHAFYLGKELARAHLAMTLGKTYRQEGALSWGYLTPPDEARSEHVTLTQKPRTAGHRVRFRRGSEVRTSEYPIDTVVPRSMVAARDVRRADRRSRAAHALRSRALGAIVRELSAVAVPLRPARHRALAALLRSAERREQDLVSSRAALIVFVSRTTHEQTGQGRSEPTRTTPARRG